MSTYIIYYALIALGVVLATLFVFKKFIPAEIDPFFVKSNRRERNNGLTFDPSLSFFRLKQHYNERIKDKKVFKFSLKNMEKFKNTATKIMAEYLINQAKNSGLGISVVLVRELSGSFKVCLEDENEVLKLILQNLSHQQNIVDALKKELFEYEQHIKESYLKENPDKSREVCINKLSSFFTNLKSFDVSNTKLSDFFEADYERLKDIIDPKSNTPLIKEQKSALSS